MVDFRTVDEAAFAVSAMHGHPFDAKHQFKVNLFTDIERYQNLDETYVEPAQEVYRPKVCLTTYSEYYFNDEGQEHLKAWLADPQGRDQYVTYRGEDVEIHWHGKPSQCEVAFARTVGGLPSRPSSSDTSYSRTGQNCMYLGHR